MLIRLARSMIFPTARLWKATKQAQSFPEIRGKNVPGSISNWNECIYLFDHLRLWNVYRTSLTKLVPKNSSAKAASMFWRAESCLHKLLHVLHLWDLRVGDSRFPSLKDFKTESVDTSLAKETCILNLDNNTFKMAMNFKMFWAKMDKESFNLPSCPPPNIQ